MPYTGDKDFDEILGKCLDILQTKSADYAEDGDRLAEFRATAEEMGISMRQALGVYMNKHLRSIKKWVKGEELKGEPIEDKLLDIIVYCLLGYKMVKEEKKNFFNNVLDSSSKNDLCWYIDSCSLKAGHKGPCEREAGNEK